ncbi:flap endonuclease GEN homolog 1 [Megalops cyprinoides]|uniref:flap endonuclease GEN homolog 1 n=1 Tax=Megalops cyprinoides TaxID=118141 RepID=UPI001864ED2D|nr:flap endonuclease GEN homolog 1 [Megalops cyprinoides]
MGVNELWSILEPVRESVPLYNLSGKTLAVDLSLWVCEAQAVKEMVGRVLKPHLRNLFFRVLSLTQMGIKLIFVMEGEAPKIKAETMCKRNQLRFGASKKVAPKTTKTNRSHFKSVLKECAEMLDCLGIPWVTAAGEAEAMCAYLDSVGVVDGCITNDGDAFLYGAQTVYRNFNMNTKDPQVDCYQMPKVRSELHLERETLVGLAVLLGCDYLPKGVSGVGKEQTLKLIKTLQGQTLLQKFVQWQSEGQEMKKQTVKKVTHCLVCRHPGSAKTHERSGCTLCGSKRFCEPQDYDYSCPCDWHRTEGAQQTGSVEAGIKRKTLASEGFPFTEIINEFLVSKDKPIQNVTRRKPNLLLMQNFAFKKMEWPKSYTSEKVLVLMTYTEMMNRQCGRGNATQIQPVRIYKPRVRNGIASFEVIWKKPDHYVYADDHPIECQDVVRTVEEESLFRAAYPDIVDLFLKEREEAEENKRKKKKQTKRKEKKPDDPDGVSDLFSQLTICSSSIEEVRTSAVVASTIPTVTTTDNRNAQKPLDFPQSSVQHKEDNENPKELRGPQGICIKEVLSPVFSLQSPVPAPSPSASSPSVSAVIEELHLSDIDWEAMSFSSVPSPRVQNTECTAPAPADPLTPVKGCSDTNKVKLTAADTGASAGIEPTVLHTMRFPAPQATVTLTKCSLRERVLAKNTIVSNNTHTGTEATHMDQSKSLNPLECTSANSRGPNTPPKNSSKAILLQEPQLPVRKPSPVRCQKASVKQTSDGPTSKTDTILQTLKVKGSKAAQHLAEQKFVKANRVPNVLPQRSSSDPSGQADHKGRRMQAVKKSVCASVCSSSENSDAENVQMGEQRKTVKSKARKRCPYLYDYNLKPTKTNSLRTVSTTAGCDSQPLASEKDKGRCAPVESRGWVAVGGDDVFIQNPVSSSQANTSKGDDSVISIDSPLPLAERLKLKFK